MRRQLRFDIWLCSLLSLLAAYGTGYIASQFSNATYDDYAQSQVAALINSDNIQQEAGSALDEIILPVGCVVYEDLTQSEDFLAQIEYGYSLSRRDFYVDMKGEGGTASKEERSSSFTGITQFITFIICFPIFHALGSRLGVFPYFFPPE